MLKNKWEFGGTLGNCESGGSSGSAFGEPTGAKSVASPVQLNKNPLKLRTLREFSFIFRYSPPKQKSTLRYYHIYRKMTQNSIQISKYINLEYKHTKHTKLHFLFVFSEIPVFKSQTLIRISVFRPVLWPGWKCCLKLFPLFLFFSCFQTLPGTGVGWCGSTRPDAPLSLHPQ